MRTDNQKLFGLICVVDNPSTRRENDEKKYSLLKEAGLSLGIEQLCTVGRHLLVLSCKRSLVIQVFLCFSKLRYVEPLRSSS